MAMAETKQKSRSAPVAVLFRLTGEDHARLAARAAREPGAYGRQAASPSDMARRFVVDGLSGRTYRIPDDVQAALDELQQDEESTLETLERVLRVGIGRARTLRDQKEKAS